MASLALPALIAGCAQEKTASTGEQAQEYLDLVMSTKYPEFHPDQWGIYIIEDTPGTGAAWTKDLKYSSLRCIIRVLTKDSSDSPVTLLTLLTTIHVVAEIVIS